MSLDFILTISCEKCCAQWIENMDISRASPQPLPVKRPKYVRDTQWDFDHLKGYKCTGCGNVIGVEFGTNAEPNHRSE